MTDKWFSINEVAQSLGVHHGTVRRLIAKGRLPAVRVGRLWRVPSSALEALEKAALAERKPLLPATDGAATENGSGAAAQN
jgi:excisionase family DNA binding protein